MNMVNLSPPYMVYFSKMSALFEYDESVEVKLINTGSRWKVIVQVLEDEEKYLALKKLLPTSAACGVEVEVRLFDGMEEEEEDRVELFKAAFKGNEIVNKVYKMTNPQGNEMGYVEFVLTPAQFYADNIGDPRGNMTVLYETIGKEIFEDAGVCMYTEQLLEDDDED